LIDFTDIKGLKASRPMILIAHRGGVVGPGSPQCSLEAIRRAASEGYDMVELDIRCSRDGVPMVFHDSSLLLSCGKARTVRQLNARILENIAYLGTNEHIVTLDAALALCKELSLGVMLDYKDRDVDDKVDRMIDKSARMLEQHGLLGATVTISGGRPAVRRALEGKPLFHISPARFRRLVKEGKPIPERCYVFGHAKDLPDDLVKQMLARGLLVIPSINTFHYPTEEDCEHGRADVERLQAAGVSGFQIDSVYTRFVRRGEKGGRKHLPG